MKTSATIIGLLLSMLTVNIAKAGDCKTQLQDYLTHKIPNLVNTRETFTCGHPDLMTFQNQQPPVSNACLVVYEYLLNLPSPGFPKKEASVAYMDLDRREVSTSIGIEPFGKIQGVNFLDDLSYRISSFFFGGRTLIVDLDVIGNSPSKGEIVGDLYSGRLFYKYNQDKVITSDRPFVCIRDVRTQSQQ